MKFLIEYTEAIIDDHNYLYPDMKDMIIEAEDREEATRLFIKDHPETDQILYKIDGVFIL